MNINFTPAIKKTVLGGIAALAVAGGAMVSCQNNTKNTETDNEKLLQTLEVLSDINRTSSKNAALMDAVITTIANDNDTHH